MMVPGEVVVILCLHLPVLKMGKRTEHKMLS